MSLERYTTEKCTGEDLITIGVTTDAYGKDIILNEEYEVRIYPTKKTKQVLTPKDWHNRTMLLIGEEIMTLGLANYAYLGCKRGFFKNPLEIVPTVEEIIKACNETEDYEVSAYFVKQINELKASDFVTQVELLIESDMNNQNAGA